MVKNLVYKLFTLALLFSLTHCANHSAIKINSQPAKSHFLSQLEKPPVWTDNALSTWHNLQLYSSQQLIQMAQTTQNPTEKAWLNLAVINKKYSNQPQELLNQLEAWQKAYPKHPANQLLPENRISQISFDQSPKQIALLLPQQGAYALAGQVVKEGFLNAYYANKSYHPQQSIRFYDTATASNIAILYQKAITDGADMIIGPLLKENVEQLGNVQTISLPTLALNYVDSLSLQTSSHLYQFGLLPEDETVALAMRARLHGLKNAMVIAPNNNWGRRLIASFNQKWQSLSGKTDIVWLYSLASNLELELKQKLQNQPPITNQIEPQPTNEEKMDSIFLFAQPQAAARIIPLLHTYLPKNIPIYANAAINANKHLNTATDKSAQEIIICELPWNLRNGAKSIGNSQNDRLYAVGQDAYLISQNLTRLSTLRNFPLYGATGALTLTTNRQIHRSIPCHAIKYAT